MEGVLPEAQLFFGKLKELLSIGHKRQPIKHMRILFQGDKNTDKLFFLNETRHVVTTTWTRFKIFYVWLYLHLLNESIQLSKLCSTVNYIAFLLKRLHWAVKRHSGAAFSPIVQL